VGDYNKVMAEENIKKDILEGVQGLLQKQTESIEKHLSEHTKQIEERLAEQTNVILTAVDERIKALDLKFTEKFDRLTTILDNFLNV